MAINLEQQAVEATHYCPIARQPLQMRVRARVANSRSLPLRLERRTASLLPLTREIRRTRHRRDTCNTHYVALADAMANGMVGSVICMAAAPSS